MIIFGLFLVGAGEESAKKARILITSAIIGLVIILAAFLIINFVVTNVGNALNG